MIATLIPEENKVKSMKPLKAHLFVCTSCTYTCNGKESDPKLAGNLRKNLKNKAAERFSKEEVRVSAVECLGQCENGIAAVMYPSGEWLLDIRPEDEDKVFNKLSDYVTRLS